MRSSSTGTSTRSAPAPSDSAPPRVTIDPRLKPPLFLLNLKCYPAALGRHADDLARHLASVGHDYGVSVGLVPSLPDLGRIAAEGRLPILAPHSDPQPPGASTGFAIPEALIAAGASGSLVNHSEHRLTPALLRSTVQRLMQVGLATVLCTRDLPESVRWARLSPSHLAVEPPDLIGGHRSVSSARPELIQTTVDSVRRVAPSVQVLCGAGIHTRRDVVTALELGSQGILVASAVATAPDPKAAMMELARGF